MAHRWFIAGLVIAAALMTGCSSSKTTTTTSTSGRSSGASTSAAATSSATSSTQAAPVTTLDTSQCVDVTGANVDLLAASDKDAARKAADTLESYNPPADVKAAIEHFVTTGGAHFDDPDYTKNNKIVKEWVSQVCPT